MWLFFILLTCIMSTKWMMKNSQTKRKRVEKILGSLLPMAGLYRDVILLLTGHFDVGFLPFHLCSMALWIGALYVWTEKYFLGVIFVWLCVPGAIGALLFPNWNVYPFWNYMHIHAFLVHGGVVVLGCWLFFSGEIMPELRDIRILIIFGLIAGIPVYLFNKICYTNFWFLNEPSKGTPFVKLYNVLGEGGYLIGYVLICFVIVCIWGVWMQKVKKKMDGS